MIITQQIQQLNKHDFVEYIQQLQLLAKKKFSFDIFIENSLSNNNKFEEHTTKQEYSWYGCLQDIDSNSVELQKQSLNYR